MGMKKTSLWVLVILVIAGLGFVVYRSSKKVAVLPPPTPPSTTVVDYFCKEGTIIASYGTGSVAISLSDGRTLTLPQVMSGSGIRYESDNIDFISKGNNAFLQEKAVTTYNDCVAGSQVSSGTTNTFTDATKLFSFSYPVGFTLSGVLGFTTDWRVQSTDSGLQLAQVYIPRSYQPGTNFSEAKFTVGTSSDPHAVTNCPTEGDGNPVKKSTVTINGTPYTKLSFGDAGAGNFYDTTSYRTLRDGQCYTIEYTIHSTNIGNYSPDQGIVEFDKIKIQNTLDGMVQSFKFL